MTSGAFDPRGRHEGFAGLPQPAQNFADAASSAPHSEQNPFAALPTAEPQPEQNFAPGARLAWHFGHCADCSVARSSPAV